MKLYKGLKTDDEKDAIDSMYSFANGKMKTDDFIKCISLNKSIQKILINDKKRQRGVYYFSDETKTIIFDEKRFFDSSLKVNPNNINMISINPELETREGLLWIVRQYFRMRKIPLVDYSDYYYRIQPSYVLISDIDLINSLIGMYPKNLSDSEQEDYAKKKLLNAFSYIDYPPNWIQNPEWPISEQGRPYVFSHEIVDNLDSSCKYYIFIDPENNLTHSVKQND